MLDLKKFSPEKELPLAVSLLQYLHSLGYAAYVPWDYFDYYVSDGDSDVIALKTIRNGVSTSLERHLALTDIPTKLILVEGHNPAFEQFKSLALTLSMTGTGLYVRGYGWAVTPHVGKFRDLDPVRYKNAPRWTQQPDGVWLKACTNCGQLLPPELFYDNPNRTARDPKRNQCIPCMKSKQKYWDDARK
jgi:hypothetical protein